MNETKNLVTISSKIHGYGSALGFMALLFVPLFISLSSKKFSIDYLFKVSLISFILAFIAFTLFVMSDKPRFANTIVAYEGIWQRLSLLFMYLPLIFMAIMKLNK